VKFSKMGDEGETSLLGGQRVPKYDPRPDTYGTFDEASSAIGIARAATKSQKVKNILLSIQKDLLILGSEVSALPGVHEKLNRRINQEDINRLEEVIDELQRSIEIKKDFIYPGKSVISAQIDLARAIIRRAERKTAKLKSKGLITNKRITQYLNRLADMLFVLARFQEENEENNRR